MTPKKPTNVRIERVENVVKSLLDDAQLARVMMMDYKQMGDMEMAKYWSGKYEQATATAFSMSRNFNIPMETPTTAAAI